MKIKNSIFNPFSKREHGIKNFKTLRNRERALTIVATVIAILACSPLFIIGGIFAGTATFRLFAEKFAKARKVVPQNLKQDHPDRKTQQVAQPQLNPKPVQEIIPENEAAKPFEAAPAKAPDLSAGPNPLMNDNQNWNDFNFNLPVPKFVSPVIDWKIDKDVLYFVLDEEYSEYSREFIDVQQIQLCLDLINYRMDFFDGKCQFLISAYAPMEATLVQNLKKTYRGQKLIRLHPYWNPDTNRRFYHLHLKKLSPEDGYAVEQKV
jgi:hypothetical protein